MRYADFPTARDSWIYLSGNNCMDEAKLALEVTKGIKGFFQDFVAPDVKAIIAVLNQHTKLLDQHTELLKEHSQKLGELTESVSGMRVILNSHTQLLKEHSQKLDGLTVAVSEMKYVPELLNEDSQKLDKLDDGIHQVRVGQAEILARLDLEKRLGAPEKAVAEIRG